MTTNAPKLQINPGVKYPNTYPFPPPPKPQFSPIPSKHINQIIFNFTHTEAIALLSVLTSVCDFEDPLLLKVAAVIKDYEKNNKY